MVNDLVNDRVKRGLLGLILGVILAVFGWADLEYYLTELPIVINQFMEIIGVVIAIIGLIYIITGLIKKNPTQYPSVRPPSTPPPPPPGGDSPYCTQCGHQMDQNATFCPNCGFKRT
jgi:hypothetical protein